jgi:hypothetical protein
MRLCFFKVVALRCRSCFFGTSVASPSIVLLARLAMHKSLVYWGFSMLRRAYERTGGFRWGLAALILGLPLPIVILAFLSPGCR